MVLWRILLVCIMPIQMQRLTLEGKLYFSACQVLEWTHAQFFVYGGLLCSEYMSSEREWCGCEVLQIRIWDSCMKTWHFILMLHCVYIVQSSVQEHPCKQRIHCTMLSCWRFIPSSKLWIFTPMVVYTEWYIRIHKIRGPHKQRACYRWTLESYQWLSTLCRFIECSQD